ncbi:hypothetical protein FEM48_Zijuj04G0023400 [Ziziphus jujuba var. spinosa]|uniref:Dynamin N-terminal domain-containing protein n=1 Tax=Ziziphus jujuba var. spinosa TaxID=714518 RepID=A0A978VHA2_ZIZJJ|nr:hypothetical protein FEM48_Zijuj04G0023400 [Ziziphus jujuba var. spinosa]
MLVHVVRIDNCFDFEGANKSTVLNSLIGHPVLPNGEKGATQAPISIDLQRDGTLSSKLYKKWTLVGALTVSGQGSCFQYPNYENKHHFFYEVVLAVESRWHFSTRWMIYINT